MRTLTAPIAQAIERRGIALERDAYVTLRRDAYATPPGPSLGVAIGERTHYRPGAWLSDPFERASLGPEYSAWGGSAGLTLVAGRVEPVGVGAIGQVTHRRTVPRDPWAAVQLAALSGPSAVGGVLLRATTTDAYRITATSAGQTVVESIIAGTPTTLTSVATPWRAGDVLRAEIVWTRLRVYREPILVAEVTVPAPTAGAGWAGLVVRRAVSGDAAALTHFVAGEARMEYLGAGLDLGDVQRVLGQPASFDLTLSNVAPMGGAASFAALLRHGLNEVGTYDLDKGEVRILTVVDGLAPPLIAGVGWIDGPGDVTEDRVRLVCRGRDAFLTPQLAPGPVTYLPGPLPGGLLPLPATPCAVSSLPLIEPGGIPGEPPGSGPPGDGIGPDEPPPPPPPPPPPGTALTGLWLLFMGRGLTGPVPTVFPSVAVPIPLDTGALPDVAPTDAYVATPPDWFFEGFAGSTGDLPAALRVMTRKASAIEPDTAPTRLRYVAIYRGSEISGTTLTIKPGYTEHDIVRIVAGYSTGTPSTPEGFIPPMTVICRRYTGAGITSQADLEAIHPASADGSLPSTFPVLLEPAKSWTFGAEELPAEPAGGYRPFINTTGIPTGTLTGPDLFVLELAGDWAATATANGQEALLSLIFRRTPLGPTQNQRIVT